MIVGGFETADNRGLLFAICTSVAFAVFAVLLRANRKLDMLPVFVGNRSVHGCRRWDWRIIFKRHSNV